MYCKNLVIFARSLKRSVAAQACSTVDLLLDLLTLLADYLMCDLLLYNLAMLQLQF